MISSGDAARDHAGSTCARQGTMRESGARATASALGWSTEDAWTAAGCTTAAGSTAAAGSDAVADADAVAAAKAVHRHHIHRARSTSAPAKRLKFTVTADEERGRRPLGVPDRPAVSRLLGQRLGLVWASHTSE